MRTLTVHFPDGAETFSDRDFTFTHDLFKHTIEVVNKNDQTDRREINNVAYEIQYNPDPKENPPTPIA